MDTIFYFPAYFAAAPAVACAGWLAGCAPAWLKNWAMIHIFIAFQRGSMTEAASWIPWFASFNAFLPALGCRVPGGGGYCLSADKTIHQSVGRGHPGRSRVPGQGQSFSTWELLGGDASRAEQFADGWFR